VSSKSPPIGSAESLVGGSKGTAHWNRSQKKGRGRRERGEGKDEGGGESGQIFLNRDKLSLQAKGGEVRKKEGADPGRRGDKPQRGKKAAISGEIGARVGTFGNGSQAERVRPINRGDRLKRVLNFALSRPTL